MRGKFITFEGVDGCGKSTQLEKLAEVLRKKGLEVITTREPGGTPIGEKIRAVLLDSRTAGLAPMTELTMMFASRAQQIEQVVIPAVTAGKWVLCDRFTDSSEAYQGAGRQLGIETVLGLHKLVCRDFQPDLTILLISDSLHTVQRAAQRNQRQAAASDENRFELENSAFFDRVAKGYLHIAEREPQRVAKIDAAGSIAQVHERVIAAVHERLQLAAHR
jgi:dTMP kinase